jgi:hypothetical protein
MAIRSIPPRAPSIAPYLPPKVSKAVAYATKAVAGGTADANQQQLFMTWLIEEASRAHDMSYRPAHLGGQSDTDFAEGKRYVGLSVIRLVRMAPADIDELEAEKRVKGIPTAPAGMGEDDEIRNT